MNQKSAAVSATIRTGSLRDVAGGTRNDWLLVFGLMGVAIAIRMYGLSDANLWLDEANSWQVASKSWPALFADLRSSPVGPLYFVLLKLWIAAAGDSATALRALSVIASIALIVATYALGARLLSRGAGLLGAALIAFSPLELYFAQEARMYMLTALIAVLCVWAYARWRTAVVAQRAGASLALAWYVVSALLLLLAHPVAGTLLVAINLDALLIWWQLRGTRAGMSVTWIAAQASVLVLITIYIGWLHTDGAASSQAWRSGLGFEQSLREAMLVPFAAIGGRTFYPWDFWYAFNDTWHELRLSMRFLALLIVQPLTLLVFVLALESGVRHRKDQRVLANDGTSPENGARLLSLAFVVPLAIAVGISISRSLEMQRYFFFVVPFLLLLLADGLLSLERRTRFACLATLFTAMLIGTRATRSALSRDSDYRSTAALLARESLPGDRVLIQPREMNAPLRFYLRSTADSIIGVAAGDTVGRVLATLAPGRAWIISDYRSPLYALAPDELRHALAARIDRDSYMADVANGVRATLVDTRVAIPDSAPAVR